MKVQNNEHFHLTKYTCMFIKICIPCCVYFSVLTRRESIHVVSLFKESIYIVSTFVTLFAAGSVVLSQI